MSEVPLWARLRQKGVGNRENLITLDITKLASPHGGEQGYLATKITPTPLGPP
jgi:hypothetical protein